MSSNTTIATRAPDGGLSEEASTAKPETDKRKDRENTSVLRIDFISINLFPGPGRGWLGRRLRRGGFLQHVFHNTAELRSVRYFNCRNVAAANNKDGGRVLQADLGAQSTVCQHLLFQLALRVGIERQRCLVIVGKLLHELPQVALGDLRLVAEDETAKIIAQLGCFGIKVARVHRRIERPGMLREREVMQDHRHLVSIRRFPDHGIGASAIRALQVFKHHDGYPRSGRWLQGRTVSRMSAESNCHQRGNCSEGEKVFHHFAPWLDRLVARGTLFLAGGGGVALASISSIIWLSCARSLTSSTSGCDTPLLPTTQIVGVCSTPMRWPRA